MHATQEVDVGMLSASAAKKKNRPTRSPPLWGCCPLQHAPARPAPRSGPPQPASPLPPAPCAWLWASVAQRPVMCLALLAADVVLLSFDLLWLLCGCLWPRPFLNCMRLRCFWCRCGAAVSQSCLRWPVGVPNPNGDDRVQFQGFDGQLVEVTG